MYALDVLRAAAGEVRDVLRGSTPTHVRLRDRVAGIAVATIGIDLVCALLALLFEHGAKQSEVTNFGTAVFWTSTQLLTVSSSVMNPLTTGGRILDVVMEIYAITVIAGLAGAVGAFLIKRGREIDEAAEARSGGGR